MFKLAHKHKSALCIETETDRAKLASLVETSQGEISYYEGWAEEFVREGRFEAACHTLR